jgi:alpha-galactosidase
MERRCPQAWLINYTNPVPRIATALRRATSIRSIGVCHQLDFGYFMVGCLLAEDLGIELPADCRFRWTDESVARMGEVAAKTKRAVRIVAAGLNHFTWIQTLSRRTDGQDLLPRLRERSIDFDRGFEPLTRQIFRLFDTFPVPGDCHLAEYLPYTHNPARQGWNDYDIQAYDHQWSERQRRARVAEVEAMLESGDASQAEAFGSERAEDLVVALLDRSEHHDEALNLQNAGAIANLPDEAIVEVPATIQSAQPSPVSCGALPEPIAELCRRQITINELCAAGLCDGDRRKLVQALALDPMVDDPRLPDRLLDAYLEDSLAYLTGLLG